MEKRVEVIVRWKIEGDGGGDQPSAEIAAE